MQTIQTISRSRIAHRLIRTTLILGIVFSIFGAYHWMAYQEQLGIAIGLLVGGSISMIGLALHEGLLEEIPIGVIPSIYPRSRPSRNQIRAIFLVVLMVLSLPAMFGMYGIVPTDHEGVAAAEDSDEMAKVDSFRDPGDDIRALSFGDDGYLYSGDDDNNMHKIDPETMNSVDSRSQGRNIYVMHFGFDGYLYGGGGGGQSLDKIDPDTMTVESSWDAYDGVLWSVDFGSDGYLYIGQWDTATEVWYTYKVDPDTMTQVDEYTGHEDAVDSVYFGDDGYLYSGSSDNEIHKLDPETMEKEDDYTGHTSSVNSIDLGLDGYLYSGSSDDEVHRIDPETMENSDKYTEYSDTVLSVRFGSDGYVYAAGEDNQIHRIDPKTVIADTISGQVIDQDGDPVPNANVEAWGVDFDHPDIGGLEQEAEQILDEAADVEPDDFDDHLDPEDDVFSDLGDESTYAVAHTAGEWDLSGVEVMDRAFTVDTTELDAPDVVLPEDETIILSKWDADDTARLQDTVDASLPGSTTSGEIVIERIDAGGESTSSYTEETDDIAQVFTVIANRGSKTHEGVSVDLDAGFYRIYPDGHESASYVIAVGDPGQIMSSMADDLEDEAGELTSRAAQLSDRIEDDMIHRATVQADENGYFEADLPASTERAAVQAHTSPEEFIDAVEDVSITDIQDAYSAGYNGSIYFGEPQRFDVPEEDAEVEVFRVDTPPGHDIEDRLDTLRDQFESLLDDGLSDLEGAIDGVLDLVDADELKELHDDFTKLADDFSEIEDQITDPEALAEQIANILDEDLEDELDADDLDDLDDDEILEYVGDRFDDISDDTDDLDEDNLTEEIEVLEATISNLEEKIDSEIGDVEIDDDSIYYEVEFDRDLDDDDIIAMLTYEDGTTESVPADDISVSSSGGVLDDGTLVTIDTEIDDDAAIVRPRVQVVSDGERGTSSDAILAPGFDNDIPSLDAIDISTDRPGPDERISVEPRPSDAATFDAVTEVSVTAPNGSVIDDVELDDDRARFTTDGSGIYTVQMTMTNPQGNEFIETVDIRARDDPGASSPTVRLVEGITGDHAIAADGLESARVDYNDDETDIEAIVSDGEGAPGELHVYPGDKAFRGDRSDISIGIYEGDLEEQVRSHVATFVHVEGGLDDDAILWRDGDPITRDGETRFGEVDDRDNRDVIVTYTDSSGETMVSIIHDPSILDRIDHRLSRMMTGLPYIGSMTVPISIGAVIPLISIPVARREVIP